MDPLSHNLEIINSVQNGRLNPHQDNFQIDAYTARCQINEGKTAIRDASKKAFLMDFSVWSETTFGEKSIGGMTIDEVSFRGYKTDEDVFEMVDIDRKLSLTTLLRFYRSLVKEGINLLKVLEGALEGDTRSQETLQSLCNDSPSFREAVYAALETWSGEGLIPAMAEAI